MRKKNNMHRRGGHRGSGGGRYQNNGGGGRGNEQQNLARQKHHAMQQREKYANMARDAQVNGDRTDVEYYLQHVDHYTRVLTDIAVIEAERYAQQREQQIVPGGPNDPNAQHQQAEDNGAGNHGNADGNGDMDELSGNQPRMTRPQHRGHQAGNGEAQAAAPAASGNEIPLPGSVLTAL